MSVVIASRPCMFCSFVRWLQLITMFPCVVCVAMVLPEHPWGGIGLAKLSRWDTRAAELPESRMFKTSLEYATHPLPLGTFGWRVAVAYGANTVHPEPVLSCRPEAPKLKR